jgi:glycogen(starch) synthase
MVSWEYPPLIFGGLGRHVHGLAEALAVDGHEVTVLTQGLPAVPDNEVVNRVRIVRVRTDASTDDFAAWVAALNKAQTHAAYDLVTSWQPDVVHAHDWLSADAGVALGEANGCPLVATIHATEAGLWDGWLTTPLSRARHDAEAWLVRAAARTIVCSEAMRAEVSTGLKVDPDELITVHNAVHPTAWQSTADQRAVVRAAMDVPDDAPLVVLAGRIEWEKGGDVAVRALPRIRAGHPGTQLVLAGAGSQQPALAELARTHRVARSVHFAGHLEEHELAALLGTADVALVPSSYEPFGMVALEASAAGTPVIAGSTGGLPEVITSGETGLLVPPRDPGELAEAVVRILDDPAFGDRLVLAARRDIAGRFVWPATARATERVYAEAVSDPRPPRPRPRPVAAGNVFTGEPVG